MMRPPCRDEIRGRPSSHGTRRPAHARDDVCERFALARQAPVNRAPIDTHVLRHRFDAAFPALQETHDEAADLRGGLVGIVIGIGLEHLAREARDSRIGIRILDGEIALRTDDPVESLAEFDAAGEQALVLCAIPGRIVREAHT